MRVSGSPKHQYEYPLGISSCTPFMLTIKLQLLLKAYNPGYFLFWGTAGFHTKIRKTLRQFLDGWQVCSDTTQENCVDSMCKLCLHHFTTHTFSGFKNRTLYIIKYYLNGTKASCENVVTALLTVGRIHRFR